MTGNGLRRCFRSPPRRQTPPRPHGLRAVAVAIGTGKPLVPPGSVDVTLDYGHWRAVEAVTWKRSLASCCVQGS